MSLGSHLAWQSVKQLQAGHVSALCYKHAFPISSGRTIAVTVGWSLVPMIALRPVHPGGRFLRGIGWGSASTGAS